MKSNSGQPCFRIKGASGLDKVHINKKRRVPAPDWCEPMRMQTNYVLEENFPVFKMPPVIRETEETTLLGIDISILIEKLEKGEL